MVYEPILEVEEINKMVNDFFEIIENGGEWGDQFDNIIFQITNKYSTIYPEEVVIDKCDDVMAMFQMRASQQEFSSFHYNAYLRFAIHIQRQEETIDDLLRYGIDILYPKLFWTNKLYIF